MTFIDQPWCVTYFALNDIVLFIFFCVHAFSNFRTQFSEMYEIHKLSKRNTFYHFKRECVVSTLVHILVLQCSELFVHFDQVIYYPL